MLWLTVKLQIFAKFHLRLDFCRWSLCTSSHYFSHEAFIFSIEGHQMAMKRWVSRGHGSSMTRAVGCGRGERNCFFDKIWKDYEEDAWVPTLDSGAGLLLKCDETWRDSVAKSLSGNKTQPLGLSRLHQMQHARPLQQGVTVDNDWCARCMQHNSSTESITQCLCAHTHTITHKLSLQMKIWICAISFDNFCLRPFCSGRIVGLDPIMALYGPALPFLIRLQLLANTKQLPRTGDVLVSGVLASMIWLFIFLNFTLRCEEQVNAIIILRIQCSEVAVVDPRARACYCRCMPTATTPQARRGLHFHVLTKPFPYIAYECYARGFTHRSFHIPALTRQPKLTAFLQDSAASSLFSTLSSRIFSVGMSVGSRRLQESYLRHLQRWEKHAE